MLSPAPDSPSAIPLVPLGRASLNLYPQFVSEVEEISGRAARAAPRRRDRSALFGGCGAPTEHTGCVAPRPGIADRTAAHRRSAQARAGVGPGSACGGVDGIREFRRSASSHRAVLAAASTSGVELRSDANVTRILEEAGRCNGVATDTETFGASNVVLAAGAFSGKIQGIAAPIAVRPIRGQMVALNGSDTRLRHVLRSERGYLVPRAGASAQRIVAGSTLEDAGFEKRVTPGGLEGIFSAAQELVPALAGAEVLDTWCGLRPDTPDHLPLLGPSEMTGLTIATGPLPQRDSAGADHGQAGPRMDYRTTRFHGLAELRPAAV